MEINSQGLSTCEIVPDEDAISLRFIDAMGSPIAIRISLDQASALDVRHCCGCSAPKNLLAFTGPNLDHEFQRWAHDVSFLQLTEVADDGYAAAPHRPHLNPDGKSNW
jgi:hypothetical protein